MLKYLFTAHVNILIIGILTLSTNTYAQLITWKDNIPSSVESLKNDPEALANLAQDKIMVFAHTPVKTYVPTLKNNPNPTATFTTTAVVLPVSAQTIEKTLSDFDGYVGLYPTLKSAKVLEQSGNITQVKYKVSIPTPVHVLNFNEDIIFQHQFGKNTMSSLIIDAPVPYGIGKFEWFSLGENKTLLTLTQWSDLNQAKGFVIRRMMNAVPEAKLGVPSGTGVFIIESLRKRLSTTKAIALNAGQLPSPSLNANQIEKVSQLSQTTKYPVNFVHLPASVPYQHGRETLRFVTTYQYFSKPPQQLQKWTQANSYKDLFPRQIKSIATTSIINKNQNAEFKVSIGLGVINIPFNFKMNFNYPSEFENDFYANGGDLKYLKGQIKLEPYHQGTLLKMTTAAKIDESAPFLLRAVRSLPYHDILPTVGGNVVFVQKMRAKN